ncbi:unnamed protein product [Aphanomyces euteiches]|uniref:RING-type E3 ubiquitin transferase n=1 Tax=Aphanomyces euteiches TaxID=100861 RepID=A0A6G0XDF6_9STRA|nr:hypothetical protein Ae201684_006031 [Aphanomyces euteiches]KAH9069124.1 hypothetical protein Ae201684P_004818 [Aphanomyces euteiches]KAH9151685.1 hypothetical protein AeRB84_005755 [Aphanomyces euteiches]
MDMRNDAVILVYAGQGGNGGGGGGGNRENGPGLMILGREEQEYQMNMQRNRLQRLLSTTIFVCFFLLFLDGNSQQQRMRSSTHPPTDKWPYTENATKRDKEIAYFDSLLAKELTLRHPGETIVEDNITGVYKGEWTMLAKSAFETEQASHEANRFVHPTYRPYYGGGGTPNHVPATSDVATVATGGVIWFILSEKPTPSDEVNTDVAYVVGQVIMHDESLAMTILPVQGVFLRRIGRLTLFGNMPDASVELTYDSMDNASTTTVDPDNDGKSHLEISPLRYNPYTGGNQRLRTGSNGFNGYSSREQCVYTIDMEVDRGQIKTGSAVNSVGALGGIGGSDVCGLYWRANVTFIEENFNLFYTKASGYAIVMAVLCLVQIYLLLKQLQQSSTQAAAAKVSLITIGQQAVVDSYLCLLHLTTGIVAQHVFTLFATVSFFQLIIFSIFEMRFLLVIWKARRPQQFTEGWNVMRRELTTLYSRFYISLLFGLCLIYYGWKWLHLLVIIACSFWVPQIVHNVHREVRNPFDTSYILGMSVTRLFLPLYLYGCPKNFLTAMPIFPLQYHPNLCYGLVAWMALQVAVLLLQRHWGPRFFIPAMFLPVKYNYERRMDPDQLSLLRVNQGDELDCVICMVELDVDARDYMIAPCDHIFHRPCLQEWMQVKMECPTCRSPLPEP